jgi:hypothetical protein
MPRAQSWGFEAACGDGSGVFVRLTLLPEEHAAWYWAYLFVPDVGLVVVRDHEVPLPRRGAPDLEVRADALWAELVCETPGEHWGIGLEAFGVVLDDPWDALRGELGTRVPVGLDLEWEHLAPEYRDGDRREHQFGRVHGEILVGPERIPFDATGTREASRGDLPVDPGRHHAAFAIGESFAVDFASGSGDDSPATGYVWKLGDPLVPVHHVLTEARPAEPAVPTALRYVLDGELEIEAESVAHAVVPLTQGGSPAATYLLKTLTRVLVDEQRGAGFSDAIYPVERADAPQR